MEEDKLKKGNSLSSIRNWKMQRHTILQIFFIVAIMAGITSYYIHGAFILTWIAIFVLILADRKLPVRKIAVSESSIVISWFSNKIKLSIPFNEIRYHELTLRYSIKDRMELMIMDVYTDSKKYSFTQYEFSNIKELHDELSRHLNPGPEPLFVTKTKNVWLVVWGGVAIVVSSGLFYLSLTNGSTNSFLGVFFLLFAFIGIGMIAAYGRIK